MTHSMFVGQLYTICSWQFSSPHHFGPPQSSTDILCYFPYTAIDYSTWSSTNKFITPSAVPVLVISELLNSRSLSSVIIEGGTRLFRLGVIRLESHDSSCMSRNLTVRAVGALFDHIITNTSIYPTSVTRLTEKSTVKKYQLSLMLDSSTKVLTIFWQRDSSC